MRNSLRVSVAGLLCLIWLTGCGSGAVMISGKLDTPETAYTRGIKQLRAGSPTEAVAAFDHARTLDPGYAPAYEGLSRAALAQGKLDEAIRHIRVAKSKDTGYAPVWIVTGLLYTAARRYSAAIAEYEEALRIDPDRLWAVETYLELGNTYEKMGNAEQAHEAFVRVLALEPLHAQARTAIRRTRQTLGPGFLTRLRHEGKTEIIP